MARTLVDTAGFPRNSTRAGLVSHMLKRVPGGRIGGLSVGATGAAQ